ncbi:VOC family protein [Paenibacillus sp. TRM 82003]|nr:VOC family protein [Kineococcus sp. TRM81007]MCI2237435.1 VOC family protein [Kineococcus sp. TRM81007]MCI3919787.1 VOC family protein [Paenibacillus sp. TRM 82003]
MSATGTSRTGNGTGGGGPRPAVRLGMVVLDTPDPRALADFYAQLLGWRLDPEDTSDDWVTVRGEGGTALGFQRAPGVPRPTWPGGGVHQQLHLDLDVDDYDEPEARALALGATVLDAGRDHLGFRVYADPSGHPFCLCRQAPDEDGAQPAG